MSQRTCSFIAWGFTLTFVLMAGGRLHAQRDITKIPDPDSEIERRSFQVADGFEVNLFAADPLLAKPIQMNFDPAGRLWVATSEVYPQIKPGQKANDKIIILEDRDGDGRADKTTVFVDGLLIPTGVEPGDGGAYVANSTELLHFADRKGTGHADRQRIVLSGFGTEDTHHIIHTLRWGPDGMLYFNQSTYIHSHVETPYGVRRLGGGGIWQFRPETMQLEIFLHGLINPWGHHFDRWGQSFATDGAGGEGINYVVRGASYAWTPGASRVIHGLNPGSPKHCGAEIVSGRHLPEDWQGNILTNDFRGHRVCRFVLSEDSAGFAAQEKTELIKTNHPAFRPVDIKMGPDGAIYIADWYNPIIQHGEVDFRDPRRDRTHGRIWRVTAKGRPLVARPRLVGATTEELLEALKAPEDWTRQQAKRVLKERGAQVVPALTAWVRKLDSADRDHDHQLLEALWTYQALDIVEPNLLKTLLNAKDHRARAAATRVLQYWHARLPDSLELLAARVIDDHPRVRLEAVRALGRIPDSHAVEVAMRALDRPVDRYLDYALWLTARELEPYWLPALQAGRLDFGGNTRHLLFALQAVGREGIKPLVALLKAGKIAKERQESVLLLMAAVGGPEELRLVFDHVLSADGGQAGTRAKLLAALQEASRQRSVRPAGDLSRVGKLLTAEDEAVRAAAAQLAGLWKLESFRPQLLDYARAAGTSEPLRKAAFAALTQLGGPASQQAFEQLAGPSHPPEMRVLAVTALTSADLQSAARHAVELLRSNLSDADTTELITTFVRRKGGTAVLAKNLANQKLPADVAKIALRTTRASGRDAPVLVEALTKAGGLTSKRPPLTHREMEQLVADVVQHGNPYRGEMIFRRKDLACLKCHAIAGAGGQVGPDLISLGASAPIDYLIDSILLPNKAIKENYHSLVVGTKDGRVFTGIKVRETSSELILRDAEDRDVAIPIQAIEERANGGSLMPEGLADSLTRRELVDLVRFLSELGKVGPFAVSKARLVRRWQAVEPTAEARRLLQAGGLNGAIADDHALSWTPVYSTVSGLLPLNALPGLRTDSGTFALVRCQFEASTNAKARLKLNTAKGLTLWLDRAPLETKQEVVLDLAAGTHTITVAINLGERSKGLRCELDAAPGSAARVHIVKGK